MQHRRRRHWESRMALCRRRRRGAAVLLLLMAGVLALRLWPAPTDDSALYLKQTDSGTCTLTAAAMLLRRAAAQSHRAYADFTPDALRPTAWCAAGLRFTFTYDSYTVSHSTFPSDAGPAVAQTLLRQHPEGLLLYNESVPHGILLLDYDAPTGRFYAADPSRRAPKGRIPLTDTVLPGDSDEAVLRGVSAYWYVAAADTAEANQTAATPAAGASPAATSSAKAVSPTVTETEGVTANMAVMSDRTFFPAGVPAHTPAAGNRPCAGITAAHGGLKFRPVA